MYAHNVAEARKSQCFSGGFVDLRGRVLGMSKARRVDCVFDVRHIVLCVEGKHCDEYVSQRNCQNERKRRDENRQTFSQFIVFKAQRDV